MPLILGVTVVLDVAAGPWGLGSGELGHCDTSAELLLHLRPEPRRPSWWSLPPAAPWGSPAGMGGHSPAQEHSAGGGPSLDAGMTEKPRKSHSTHLQDGD